ncbi:MAG: hypothetical protein HQL39_11955 [Alphaproteobacteria bacterium]|nr:hypothetical protein [Alphaproteobacteria bacterium]
MLAIAFLVQDHLSVPQADDPHFLALASARPFDEILRFGVNKERLYIAWLRALVLVLEGHATVEFANAAILAVASALLFLNWLKRLRISTLPAIGAALLLGGGFLSLGVWPRNGMFGFVVYLAFAVPALAQSTPGRRFGVIVLGCVAASLARPEYALGLPIAVGLGLAMIASRRSGWRDLGFLGAAVGLSALTAVTVGLPFFSNADRAQFALSQHFALNWTSWHEPIAVNPWIEHERVWAEQFGGATGLLSALGNNPGAMALHLAHNTVRAVPLVLLTSVSPVRTDLVPAPVDLADWLPLLPILLLVLWAARRGARAASPERLRGAYTALSIWIPAILPTLAETVILYPRYHYLFAMNAAWLTLLALLLSRESGGRCSPRIHRPSSSRASEPVA